MPRRKPKPEKVVQEQIKASLDSILLDEQLDIDSIHPGELPRLKNDRCDELQRCHTVNWN